MSLIINDSNNFFELVGVLDRENAENFKEVLTKGLREFNTLTVSIEGLDRVDKYGVKAFSELHTLSLKENKQLSIVGLGCKDLYNHFKSQSAA